MIPLFAEQFHCIAIDLPGHGETPYCDNILGVLRSWMPLKPLLIGYSMGGRIAMQLHAMAAALVNISGHVGLKSPFEKEARLKNDELWAQKLLTLPIESFLQEWYAQPVFKNSSLKDHLKKRLKQNPQSLSSVLRQLTLSQQHIQVDFACPTLFLCGENDLKYQELFSRLKATHSVRQIQACGHAPHLEDPAQCAKTILNWLENIYGNNRRKSNSAMAGMPQLH